MRESGVETIHKVSGTVTVSDLRGGTVKVSYVANIGDKEDTCDPKKPADFEADRWNATEDDAMEARYEDAYERIDKQRIADATLEPVQPERPNICLHCGCALPVDVSKPYVDCPNCLMPSLLPDTTTSLKRLSLAAGCVTSAWEHGELAEAVRGLEATRIEAERVLKAFARPTNPQEQEDHETTQS